MRCLASFASDLAAEFDPPSTTQLSPHLKVRRYTLVPADEQFGTLSCRLFYWRLREVIDGTKHSEPPTSLIGQLLFREVRHRDRLHADPPAIQYLDEQCVDDFARPSDARSEPEMAPDARQPDVSLL